MRRLVARHSGMGAVTAIAAILLTRLDLWDWLDPVQWPAMATTVLGAWWVGSQKKPDFWTFLASNVLWVIWGLYDHAYALVALQFALAAINIRGAAKNEDE